MIKPVIQLDPTGCGIASAANLANLIARMRAGAGSGGRSNKRPRNNASPHMTYARAKRLATDLCIDVTDSTLWSSTEPVRRLLKALGIRALPGERPFTTWDALPDLALLAIKWHLERGIPHWHWVVFVRDAGKGKKEAEKGSGPLKKRVLTPFSPNRGVVLDPKAALKTHVRRDFGRMKPKWFMEIGGG